MPTRHQASWRWPRALGIGLLILSALRLPLPRADYHNIRHHDGPGEICPYHDHLMRWHPTASTDADVSLLHWHWIFPQVEPDAALPGDDAGPYVPGRGLALHAHVGDWPDPSWTGAPVYRPDENGRPLDVLALGRLAASSAHFAILPTPIGLPPAFFSACPPGGMAGLRAQRIAWLVRWVC